MLLLVSAIAAISPTALYGGSGGQVTFPPGWNLVSNPGHPDPDSNVLDGTDGPIYCYPALSTAYAEVQPGQPMSGEACWAYFDSPTVEWLGPTEGPSGQYLIETHKVGLAEGQHWAVVGNLSATSWAGVGGATQVYLYDPTAGCYKAAPLTQPPDPVFAIPPGTGAWVYSATSSIISLGLLQSGPSATWADSANCYPLIHVLANASV